MDGRSKVQQHEPWGLLDGATVPGGIRHYTHIHICRRMNVHGQLKLPTQYVLVSIFCWMLGIRQYPRFYLNSEALGILMTAALGKEWESRKQGKRNRRGPDDSRGWTGMTILSFLLQIAVEIPVGSHRKKKQTKTSTGITRVSGSTRASRA